MSSKILISILAALSVGLLGTTVYQSSQKSKIQQQADENLIKLDAINKQIDERIKLTEDAQDKAYEAAQMKAEIETQLKQAKDELAAKTGQIQELQKTLDDVKCEKDAYQAGMQELSDLIKTSKETITQLNSEKEFLQKKVDELVENRETVIDNLNAVKMENQRLKAELDELKSELAKMKNQVISSVEFPAKSSKPATCKASCSSNNDLVIEPLDELSCSPLQVSLQASWFSKYIREGFDLMDDHAAFQPAAKVDLGGTGLSFTTKWTSPCSSGAVAEEELEYEIAYENSFFNCSEFKTDYEVKWTYFDYPKKATRNSDQIGLAAAFEWPELLDCGIVPAYELIYYTPVQGDGEINGSAGFIHRFGLAYALTTQAFLPCNPQQIFDISWNVYYNDGASRTQDVTSHDWSHMVWGIDTDIALGKGTFTPGIYYQISMDDSVNEENEFWTGMTYTLNF